MLPNVGDCDVTVINSIVPGKLLRMPVMPLYICWFNFDALAQRETHINPGKPKGTEKISGTQRGSNSPPPNVGNTANCQLFSPFVSCHWNYVKTHNPNDMPEAALDIWQPVRNAQVSISKPVCVNFELRHGFCDMHICWFNFDALAQGNAYKPTKEPINYRGPSGYRTRHLLTEATPPAASCSAISFHDTEIVSKTQSQWHARGYVCVCACLC